MSWRLGEISLACRELTDQTYLHDELDRADEVTKELEDQVFLFLFHLVHTVLLSACGDFGFGKTLAGIRVQHLLRHRTSTTGLDHFFFLFDSTILRLELIDESVHILIVLVVISALLLHRRRGGSIVVSLFKVTSFLWVMNDCRSSAVKVTTGNVGAQMIRRGRIGTRMRRVLTTDDVVSVGGHVGHCRS
jgi:hypothetical protein